MPKGWIKELTDQSDELLRRIASTGYGELKEQLSSLGELCEQLSRSEARWQKTTLSLKKWEEEDITSNQTLWDIEEFEQRTISKETMIRLKGIPLLLWRRIQKNSARKRLPGSMS